MSEIANQINKYIQKQNYSKSYSLVKKDSFMDEEEMINGRASKFISSTSEINNLNTSDPKSNNEATQEKKSNQEYVLRTYVLNGEESIDNNISDGAAGCNDSFDGLNESPTNLYEVASESLDLPYDSTVVPNSTSDLVNKASKTSTDLNKLTKSCDSPKIKDESPSLPNSSFDLPSSELVNTVTKNLARKLVLNEGTVQPENIHHGDYCSRELFEDIIIRSEYCMLSGFNDMSSSSNMDPSMASLPSNSQKLMGQFPKQLETPTHVNSAKECNQTDLNLIEPPSGFADSTNIGDSIETPEEIDIVCECQPCAAGAAAPSFVPPDSGTR